MDVKSGKANLYTQAQQASSTVAKTTQEVKATVQAAPTVAVIVENKAQAGSNTAVKTEYQILASVQQAQLRNQLDQKLKLATDGFAQEKLKNNPVLAKAHSPEGVPVRDNAGNPWTTRDRNGFAAKATKPGTLSTGDGNDTVDIRFGSDGLVHVKVNDKEAWSGSFEKFKNLKIYTGGGNDVVTNTVDGAFILTGEGNDTVKNTASGTFIHTASGNDWIESHGDSNQIATGSGLGDPKNPWYGSGIGDNVFSDGKDNKIAKGSLNSGLLMNLWDWWKWER